MQQQENEQENQQQAEIEQVEESYEAPAKITCNKYHPIISEIFRYGISYIFDPKIKSLNKLFKTAIFDENLVLSDNLSKNYIEQKDMRHGALKPVNALYFTRKNGKLYCQLLTQQECQELFKTVAADKEGNSWIATTSHTVLAGKPFNGFKLDDQYQRLITQARYFNGEFNSIISDKEFDYSWLKDDSLEKINFFERHLLAKREITTDEMFLSRRIFSAYTNAVNFIIANPDQVKADFLTKMPNLNANELESLVTAAGKFNKLIGAWSKSSFVQDCKLAKKKFGVYSSAFSKYIDQLILLKEQALRLNKQNINISLFNLRDDISRFSDISIDLLRTLSRKIEPPGSKFLLTVMAMNPNLSDPLLKDVIQASKSNMVIRCALLLNNTPTEKIDRDGLEEILSLEKIPFAILSAMASHSELSDEQVLKLLGAADKALLNNNDLNHLNCRIILNRHLPETSIKDVISVKHKLNIAVIDAVLTRNDITNPEIYYTLLLKCPKNHSKQTEQLLIKLLKSATDEKHLHFIIEHKLCNKDIMLQVLNHKNCTDALVKLVLKNPELDGLHLLEILNNKNITCEKETLIIIAKMLIAKTEGCRFSAADSTIIKAVTTMEQNLAKVDKLNLDVIELCESFKTIYKKANSPAMEFLRAKIIEMRGITVFGGYKKANAIEKAILSLPLDGREMVVLDDEKPLSKALGHHRLRKTQPIYHGKEDYRFVAARSYKELDEFNKKLKTNINLTFFNYNKELREQKIDIKPKKSIITRMTEYKEILEKRKGSFWQDKSNALDYAIKSLRDGTSIDVVTFETLFPNYAKGLFTSKVNNLINEAIAESKQSDQKPGVS